MLFRAKALLHDEQLYDLFGEDIENYIGNEWRNGWVVGYYVNGYIVGDVVSADDDSIQLEYWIPVQINTVEIYANTHGIKEHNKNLKDWEIEKLLLFLESFEGYLIDYADNDTATYNNDAAFSESIQQLYNEYENNSGDFSKYLEPSMEREKQ